MNKDIISEIYKYLNRDVYRIFLIHHIGNHLDLRETYFYSYDSALEEIKNLVLENLCLTNPGGDKTLFDNIEIGEKEKKEIYATHDLFMTNKIEHPLIKAYKTVLGKTLEELIEMAGSPDSN